MTRQWPLSLKLGKDDIVNYFVMLVLVMVRIWNQARYTVDGDKD